MIQVIYRKRNIGNKQHMPFPLPLAGKQDFEFSNTSCFLQFIPYSTNIIITSKCIIDGN